MHFHCIYNMYMQTALLDSYIASYSYVVSDCAVNSKFIQISKVTTLDKT